MTFLILLAVLGLLAFRMTSPEDRTRYLGIAMAFLQDVKVAATLPRPAYEAFRAALRARSRHMIVVPAIIAIHVGVFAGMLFGAGAMADPITLVNWGANVGLRTTNGEWWRLLTSAFVHTGMLQLIVDAAVLLQLGAVVERFVGRWAFAAVYISAGVLAGLGHLAAHPIDVGIGTSAAIFGVYGLLLACLLWQMASSQSALIWQMVRRRPAAPQPDGEPGAEPDVEPDAEHAVARSVTIPLTAIKRLGFVAVVFLVSSALNGLSSADAFTGLVVGLGYGLVLGRRVSDRAPSTRAVGIAMAASMVIAVGYAWPLRNIADAKPELARVVATEERTASTFKAASERFTRGRMTAEALAQLAERTIVPELQAVDIRLQALAHVPPEHQPLVADAREFLRLRCASWRARADAIRKTHTDPRPLPEGTEVASRRMHAETRFRANMVAAGNAEGAERASLEAFEKVRRAAPAHHE